MPHLAYFPCPGIQVYFFSFSLEHLSKKRVKKSLSVFLQDFFFSSLLSGAVLEHRWCAFCLNELHLTHSHCLLPMSWRILQLNQIDRTNVETLQINLWLERLEHLWTQAAALSFTHLRSITLLSSAKYSIQIKPNNQPKYASTGSY